MRRLRRVSIMNLAHPLVGTSVVLAACLFCHAWALAALLLAEQAVVWRFLWPLLAEEADRSDGEDALAALPKDMP